MGRWGLLAMAAQYAPRLLKVRRGTWIALGVGLVALFGLAIWAAVALLGWLFGQAQGLAGAAREVVAGPAQGVVEQVGRVVSGAREQLSVHLGDDLTGPPGSPGPGRDVSGEDLGPVPRYPGLVRSVWQRHDHGAHVEYTGRADYNAVLRHYLDGFTALGYAHLVQSANREAETHVFTKGAERYTLSLQRLGRDTVSVRIESVTP